MKIFSHISQIKENPVPDTKKSRPFYGAGFNIKTGKEITPYLF